MYRTSEDQPTSRLYIEAVPTQGDSVKTKQHVSLEKQFDGDGTVLNQAPSKHTSRSIWKATPLGPEVLSQTTVS